MTTQQSARRINDRRIWGMKLFLVALLCLTSSLCVAKDETHWYSVVVASGQSTTTFTGTSDLEPDLMADGLEHPRTIRLENLRGYFAKPGQDKMSWQPEDSAKEVIIPGRAVLYVTVLKGDPAKK